MLTSKILWIHITRKETLIMSGKQGGGSSQPNGPNEVANNVGKAEGLTQSQQQELHRELQDYDGKLTYQEIRELAKDVKSKS